jgi:hypothetical protein
MPHGGNVGLSVPQNRLALGTASLDRFKVIRGVGEKAMLFHSKQGVRKAFFTRDFVTTVGAAGTARRAAGQMNGLFAAGATGFTGVKTNAALGLQGWRTRAFHNKSC